MTENETNYTELDELYVIKASKGKIMAVDFGDVRTGLAVSDASRLLASGIGNISVGGIEKTAEAIAESAKANGAVAVIVGLPENMDGSQGSRAERCKKLARMVKEQSGLLVSTFDERMTTMTAARYLNETNTRGKKRKGVSLFGCMLPYNMIYFCLFYERRLSYVFKRNVFKSNYFG